MAAGVPVIASDLGSCREVIENGKTGWLVENTDQAALAVKKIEHINRTDCRKRVEQNFTIEKMVTDYEKVYRQIFESPARKKK
jgi:glycosyltransferase involved in cell wall biosynthesis